jgi:hypothetical protein
MARAKAAGKKIGRPPVNAATVASIKAALAWGSFGRKCLNRAKNYCCPALGIDLRGSIVLDQGG